LLLRHGNARPIWRLDPFGGDATRLTSQALLLQRYRYVELAKAAGAFGLLLCSTGAVVGQAVAERLETLMRRAGRQVYRFLIGKITAEKLGNFPGVECFVSLASPEHFPFGVRDLPVPVCSPYEIEVALGAREWTGEYVTDLEELLRSPAPAGPASAGALDVQVLGAGARVRHFAPESARGAEAAARPRGWRAGPPNGRAELGAARQAPAMVTPGLHGVASSYASEPLKASSAQDA